MIVCRSFNLIRVYVNPTHDQMVNVYAIVWFRCRICNSKLISHVDPLQNNFKSKPLPSLIHLINKYGFACWQQSCFSASLYADARAMVKQIMFVPKAMRKFRCKINNGFVAELVFLFFSYGKCFIEFGFICEGFDRAHVHGKF